MRDRPSINRKIRSAPLYVFLKEFLSYCLLHLVDFFDQLLVILPNFLDLMKN